MSDNPVVDLVSKLATFDEPWSPRTVAVINDYDVRLAKFDGEFPRHRHSETDELFLVLDGRVVIELDDRRVELGPGQLFVVPRGVAHRPRVDDGVAGVLLFEPSATVNTGDEPSQRTAARRFA
jgi:mannose-6-phosphate isomerase-like protein (cupin superfamily)